MKGLVRSVSLLEDGTPEDVSFPLGVLPLPKPNENQTDFISVGDVYQMPFSALPVTNPEPSAACRLPEAMAADGEACADAYRAKLLTGLSQADAARNARMLALALSRRIYDLGAICTPDENSFGAWQFYIRMIGVSFSFTKSKRPIFKRIWTPRRRGSMPAGRNRRKSASSGAPPVPRCAESAVRTF